MPDDEPSTIELLTRLVDNLAPGAMRVMTPESAVDEAVRQIAALRGELAGVRENAKTQADHWQQQVARLRADVDRERGVFAWAQGRAERADEWLWRILAVLFPDGPPSPVDDQTIDRAEHEIEGLHNAAGWSTRVRRGTHCADVAHRPNSRGVWVCKLGRTHEGPHRAGRWTWSGGEAPEIRDGD